MQVGVGEAEAAQDLGGPRGRTVGPDHLQPRIDVAEALGRRVLQLVQQGCAFEVRRQHGLQERDGRRRMLLVDRPDAAGARDLDLAVPLDQLAKDQLEQGGLARAIAPHQPRLGAVGQGNARVVEESSAPGVEDKVADLQHDVVQLYSRARALAGGRGAAISPRPLSNNLLS